MRALECFFFGLIRHQLNLCAQGAAEPRAVVRALVPPADTASLPRWHADSAQSQWEVAGGELFSAKLSFYLDSLGPDTGALRVLPGSHRADHWVRAAAEPEGGPSLLNHSAELWGVEPQDVPGAVSLATEPGDAIM